MAIGRTANIFSQTERLVTRFDGSRSRRSVTRLDRENVRSAKLFRFVINIVIFDTKGISLLECLTITRDKNL